MVFGGLLGGNGGLTIHIDVQPSNEDLANQQVVPMDHVQSWKLNKNVFQNAKKKCVDYVPPLQQQQNMQQNMQQQQIQPNMQHPQNMQPQNQYPNNNGQQQMMMPPGPGGYPQPGQPNNMMQQQPNMNMGMDMNMNTNMNINMNTNMNMNMGMDMNMNMNANMNRGYGYGGTQKVIYAYSGISQDVQGVVNLILQPGKKYDHNGIKIQFLGRIDMSHAIYEGRPHYDFISLTKDIYPPGTLYQPQTTIPFHFRTDSKPYETYHGRNVSVRYLVRVVIDRKILPAITKDEELHVHLPKSEPTYNEAIKMEVGIEECLHIEFTYSKRYYHLNDFIIGNIMFVLVRIKIKYMELAVIRRETSGEGVAMAELAKTSNGSGMANNGGGPGGNMITETQTLTRYEIMDGAPVNGEVIPVKLYLGGIAADLTPTFNAGLNRFTVKYYLNLVLVDEEDRRYFKQQEIILWRKDLV